MQPEKQNNVLQQKLDGLTALPDAVDFDATASWQKLEKKLSPSSKQRTTQTLILAWATVAAVVVIVVASIWFLTKGDVDAGEVYARQPAKLNEKPTAVTQPVIETSSSFKSEKISTEILKAAVNQKMYLEKDVTTKGNLPVEIAFRNEELQTSNKPPTEPVVTVLPAEELQAKNYQLQTASVIPAKKFRIVHINETAPQKVDIAQNHLQPETRFPFYKQGAAAELVDELPPVDVDFQRRKDKGFIKTLTNSIKD